MGFGQLEGVPRYPILRGQQRSNDHHCYSNHVSEPQKSAENLWPSQAFEKPRRPGVLCRCGALPVGVDLLHLTLALDLAFGCVTETTYPQERVANGFGLGPFGAWLGWGCLGIFYIFLRYLFFANFRVVKLGRKAKKMAESNLKCLFRLFVLIDSF